VAAHDVTAVSTATGHGQISAFVCYDEDAAREASRRFVTTVPDLDKLAASIAGSHCNIPLCLASRYNNEISAVITIDVSSAMTNLSEAIGIEVSTCCGVHCDRTANMDTKVTAVGPCRVVATVTDLRIGAEALVGCISTVIAEPGSVSGAEDEIATG